MMDGNVFKGIGETVIALFYAAILMFPLAVWKVIDIIIWLASHISIQ